MILGIGNDLVDIRRIEKSLSKYGDRFVQRVFTDEEKKRAESRPDPAATYAKRFAVKEACAKALATGLWRQGVLFTDIGVTNNSNGQPVLVLTGAAQEHLKNIVPKGMTAQLHVTISDDYPHAQAFVIISAVPEKS
ncbi:4'-phosphopantetheinyl transferase [Kiloniella litopenaei]|uniref:Holo-[acyl-carrier-protein] synthase n=1 Tax=Kiloniella litopenaei TaxID=1549748 RepID=A0A0M2R4N7_9PROT|nr:holo-ACP synthase [Kiloniella litopenaei]KKJ76812.1 4'-phosphopantetheinyl transferase [Kiloniella litopenaei]